MADRVLANQLYKKDAQRAAEIARRYIESCKKALQKTFRQPTIMEELQGSAKAAVAIGVLSKKSVIDDTINRVIEEVTDNFNDFLDTLDDAVEEDLGKMDALPDARFPLPEAIEEGDLLRPAWPT